MVSEEVTSLPLPLPLPAPADVSSLSSVCFVPAANGTRLVAASSLYIRLGLDLTPFAFELPGTFLPYTRMLTQLGMRDAPTPAGMRELLLQLQRATGYQRLNPNELRAVIRTINFICGEEAVRAEGG